MISWLRRHSAPVLGCAVACAGLAFAIATLLPDKNIAEAVVVVPSGGNSGLTPGEASNLATTYANLIPEDRAILERTARGLGVDPVSVRSNLVVTHDFDTSILRLSFSNEDADLALRGSRLLAQSIAGPNPVSPRIAPNSLSVVAVPTDTFTQSIGSIPAAILGFVLGLVGGGLVMLAWERADARIRDPATLGAEVGCAATSFRGSADESIVALLERWTDIAPAMPVRIALLPATPAAEHPCARAAERLIQLAPRAQRQLVRVGEDREHRDLDVVLDVGGAVGGPSAGERLARISDLIVLVVAMGTPVEDVQRALDVLHQFDARPDWALLVDRSTDARGKTTQTMGPPSPASTERRRERRPTGTATPAESPAQRRAAGESS